MSVDCRVGGLSCRWIVVSADSLMQLFCALSIGGLSEYAATQTWVVGKNGSRSDLSRKKTDLDDLSSRPKSGNPSESGEKVIELNSENYKTYLPLCVK